MKKTATHATDSAGDFDIRRREQPEQPSLFPPTEDLIVPDTLRSMRKAVSAIHAIPLKEEHSHTLNSRRLFDAIIVLAQVDCRGREADLIDRVRKERISPLFEVSITDLARLAGIPGKNYKRIHEELDRLFSMTLAWNLVGEDSEVTWSMNAHFLSLVGYGKGNKRGLVRFALDPAVLSIVLEPSQWATLSFQAMRGLGTNAGYGLYQATWRYLGTANKVTAALPTATWIRLLVGESRFVKTIDGQEVVNYGDFKRRILSDAIDRVNEVTALRYKLELKEFRSGNRISRLQFKFIEKAGQPQQASIPLSWPAEVVAVLEGMGYLPRDISDLSQAYSYELVAEAIVRLKTAQDRMRAQGKIITARKAYFEGIIRNLHAGGVEDDLNDEKIAKEVQKEEAKRAAEDRQMRLKEAFQAHQRERFVAWLFALPETERTAMAEAYKTSPNVTLAEKKVMEKGLSPNNTSASAMLRAWLERTNQSLLDDVFINPEDREFESWVAWKLDQQT